MDTGEDAYFDLSADGSWIDRLRSRLPYSFENIEAKPNPEGRRGKVTRYVLSGPVLREGALSAKQHNFWRRGHVFYMVGKLIDCHSMAETWRRYRMQIGLLRLKHPGDSIGSTAFGAFDFYNSMQLEKVWGFALDNHLDRERVMMTNITQSLELCLKAMIAPASHLETGRFEFPSGHKITDLYGECRLSSETRWLMSHGCSPTPMPHTARRSSARYGQSSIGAPKLCLMGRSCRTNGSDGRESRPN